MNNDTVIARTGELLIERYQLYVLLPREPRPKDKGGGEGGVGSAGEEARLPDENQEFLTPRHGCEESFLGSPAQRQPPDMK